MRWKGRRQVRTHKGNPRRKRKTDKQPALYFTDEIVKQMTGKLADAGEPEPARPQPAEIAGLDLSARADNGQLRRARAGRPSRVRTPTPAARPSDRVKS